MFCAGQSLSEYDSTIVQIGTGGGKTFVASGMHGMWADMGVRSMFLADQDELCSQPMSAIQRFTGHIPALEKGKSTASLGADIVVASAQTLARKNRIERFPRDHFQRIIIDEAHRGCDRDKKIRDYFVGAKSIGLTATPYRQGVADLSKWYDDVAYTMPMLDLIKEGFAPPIKVMSLPLEIDISQLGLSTGKDGREYNPEDVDTTIAPYLRQIAELVSQHTKGRKGVAFLPLVSTSKAFASMLREFGLRAAHIDADSEDRDEVQERMRSGGLDWICNAGVISTGADIPPLDTLLVLKPMRSVSAYQQMVGRILRPLSGAIDELPEKEQAEQRRAAIAQSPKPYALIIDMLFQNGKLQPATSACAVASSEREAAAMFEQSSRKQLSEEDLIALKERVKAEMEASLISALESAAISHHVKTPLTAEEFGAIIKVEKIAQYQPIAKWEMEAPNPAQLAMLSRLGIKESSIKSKGHANALISALDSRRSEGLCTLKQLRLILRLSRDGFIDPVESPHLLDFNYASSIIDGGLEKRKLTQRW